MRTLSRIRFFCPECGGRKYSLNSKFTQGRCTKGSCRFIWESPTEDWKVFVRETVDIFQTETEYLKTKHKINHPGEICG
jgi:hypothetical protein